MQTRPFGSFKYDNIDKLQADIDNYFAGQDEKGKPYTMTGLALALDITPQTLCNYGKEGYAEDARYFEAVNRARLKVINYSEERSDTKDGVQGAKFMLTNNSERMGGLRYAERTETSVDIAPISFSDDLKLEE